MKKTIKKIVKEITFACPVGRKFSKNDLYIDVCKQVGRTVSKKYVYSCLGEIGEELRFMYNASKNKCESCYRMLPHSVLSAIRAKVHNLKFEPGCSEDYMRKVLRVVFSYTEPEEVFTPEGLRRVFNSVVPTITIRVQLPTNFEQIVTCICLDKEREWNLNVVFPNNLSLCTIEKIVPKTTRKVMLNLDSVQDEDSRLDRIEKKLDEVLEIIRFLKQPTKEEPVPVKPTVIKPEPVGPVVIQQYQTSTEDNTNFSWKAV